MKKLLLAGAALAAMSLPSFAADMPVKAMAPVAAMPAWAGLYVGVDAGYGWGHADSYGFAVLPGNWNAAFAATIPTTMSGPNNTDGFVAGGHIGYNWQAASIVYGLEADAMWHDQDGSRAAVNTFFGGGTINLPFTSTAAIDWTASIRARVGVLLFNQQLLVYGTAGLAMGGVSYDSFFQFFPFIDAGNPGSSHRLSISGTQTGIVAGGGLEWMVAPHWTVRGEALWYDLGTISGITTNPAFAAAQQTMQRVDFTNTVVRGGISYKF